MTVTSRAILWMYETPGGDNESREQNVSHAIWMNSRYFMSCELNHIMPIKASDDLFCMSRQHVHT